MFKSKMMINTDAIVTLDTIYDYLKIELLGKSRICVMPYVDKCEAHLEVTLQSEIFSGNGSATIADLIIADPTSEDEVFNAVISLIDIDGFRNSMGYSDWTVQLWSEQIRKFSKWAVDQLQAFRYNGKPAVAGARNF